MTEQQLQHIENMLSVKLPLPYREMSLNFPFKPIGRDWIYWLYDTADRVIDASLSPHQDGEYDQQSWKQSYVAIGEGPSGDLHLIDTLLPNPPVLLLSHEDYSLVEEWPDIAAFITDWQEEATQAEKAEAERKRNREVENRRTNRLLLVMLLLVLVASLLAFLLGLSHRRDLERRTLLVSFSPESRESISTSFK